MAGKTGVSAMKDDSFVEIPTKVPNLLGLTVGEAWEACNAVELVIASGDLDGPALSALSWPGRWNVIVQSPTPGVSAERGSVVTIDFRNDEGGTPAFVPRFPSPVEPPEMRSKAVPRLPGASKTPNSAVDSSGLQPRIPHDGGL